MIRKPEVLRQTAKPKSSQAQPKASKAAGPKGGAKKTGEKQRYRFYRLITIHGMSHFETFEV